MYPDIPIHLNDYKYLCMIEPSQKSLDIILGGEAHRWLENNIPQRNSKKWLSALQHLTIENCIKYKASTIKAYNPQTADMSRLLQIYMFATDYEEDAVVFKLRWL